MLTRNLYARIAPLVMLLALCVAPVIVMGALEAMRGGNNDVRQWLPKGLEETRQYDWFVEQFGSEEMAVVSWPGCTLDDERMDLVAQGLAAYTGPAATERPLFNRILTTRQAVDELTAEPMNLRRAEAIERLQGLLVGPDRETGGVIVMVSDAGAADRKGALQAIEQVAQGKAGIPASELRLGGPTVDSVALDSESQRSRYMLTAISVTLALFLAWRCLREVRLVAMVFATAIFCAVTSVAIVHVTGAKMNLLLIMMPTLVYLLAISGAIHLVNYYRDAIAEGHGSDAPMKAVKAAFLPCLLSAATTAVGLGSLGTSEVVPVRLFGTYSALGVLASLPVLFLFLPSALQLWPTRRVLPAVHQGTFSEEGIPFWIRGLSGWLVRYHALVVTAGLALMLWAGWGVLRLDTSVKLLNLFSPQARIIQDYAWLERQLGPLVPIEVVLRFENDSSLSMLDRLNIVSQVEEKLGDIEKVGGTMSVATFVPTAPQGYGARQIARRKMLERQLERHRDYFQEMRYLGQADGAELWRVSARVEALNSLDYGYFVERLKQQVEPVLEDASSAGLGNVQATYTGIVPLVYKAQRTLLNDLVRSFLTAFLIIGAVMVLMLRGAAPGLLSMVPNTFPALVIFGLMGLSGMLCDIGSMMTAGVAIGIAVDDTIHFLSWFRRGLAQGLSRHNAIKLAYSRCAVPMIQSSIICGLGLLVFSFSAFLPTSRFAWLMAAMLGTALVGDLLLLPALLAGPLGRYFEIRQRGEKPADERPLAEPCLEPTA